MTLPNFKFFSGKQQILSFLFIKSRAALAKCTFPRMNVNSLWNPVFGPKLLIIQV